MEEGNGGMEGERKKGRQIGKGNRKEGGQGFD